MTYRRRPSDLPRLLVLGGIFLILLYLYLVLTKPPLPASGVRSAGIESVFSIYGWGSERFNSPNSVATDADGNIYVSDTANHRVVAFTGEGRFRFAIGSKAADPQDQPERGPLLFPLGLAVSRSGDLYVASMERSLLLIYNSSGRLKKEVAIEKPIDVTIAGETVYVSTVGQIVLFTLGGEEISRFGSRGRRLGSFMYPNGLSIDEDGNIFVSDTQNSRIQIFDKKGKLIGWAGKPPQDMNDADRLFGLNMGLAIDAAQQVYVVDAFKHSIHVFDHDGNELGEYGRRGELEGRFNYPSGIASVGGGLFAVADKWNDRVQIVRISLPEKARSLPERARLIYPYVLLIALLAVLAYLSWRRRQVGKSRETN